MKKWKIYTYSACCCVFLWGAVFCGMRGSFQRYPLRVSFAYFCEKPFYNRLGVNPIFNIIKSATYSSKDIPAELASINEKDAINYVQQELNFVSTDSLNPIVRTDSCSTYIKGHPNVILVFMESMTLENLNRKSSNGQWLTPYLRSLRNKSIYCANAYSAGIHTNNGIVGVHYGYVPNFAKNAMPVNAPHYTGLPYYLQRAGYKNIVFLTGNPQYDNMNSFWRDNSITTIYSLYDYSTKHVVNNFGVSDGYMFSWGLNKLNEISLIRQPFFASFLTVSNHSPFVIPEEYQSRGNSDEERIIAYADDAIRLFVDSAQQTEWGKNALFILVADHGTSLPSPYEMGLSYNTIPIFIFHSALTPQVITSPVSQIDIWPTVLNLLGIVHENNSLGIDFLNNRRRYAFFVNDEHLGVSDGEYFFCLNIQSRQEFLYRIGNGKNIIEEETQKVADMREYGLNMERVNLLAITKKWTEPRKQ